VEHDDRRPVADLADEQIHPSILIGGELRCERRSGAVPMTD
jgi:hypothetical protein